MRHWSCWTNVRVGRLKDDKELLQTLAAKMKQQLLARDECQFINKLAEETKAVDKNGYSEKLYCVMCQLSGKPLPPLHPAVAVDGSPLVTVDSQLSRWKKHFKALRRVLRWLTNTRLWWKSHLQTSTP